MAEANTQQTILYSLRSPTTPIKDKLILARSNSNKSTPINQVIRDWVLDNLLKSLRNTSGNGIKVLDGDWWKVLEEVTKDEALGGTTVGALPIFVAFVQQFPTALDADLLRSFRAVWKRLGLVSLRKSTIDGVLESWAALLESSVTVFGQNAQEEVKGEWEGLAVEWMKGLRVVVDTVKSGKKVPQTTLLSLDSITALLSLSPSSHSSFQEALHQTLTFTLFNLDNLRRGIARESYNAGSSGGDVDLALTAEGELLAGLKESMERSSSRVIASTPLLFNLYTTSLSSHSSILFPLPSKTTLSTASAYRSAAELYALQKVRFFAGRWIGHLRLVLGKGGERAMWKCLEVVERGGLMGREKEVEGWKGVLEGIVEEAMSALEEEVAREDIVGLLGICARLNWAQVEEHMKRILEVLAGTPATWTTESDTFENFLMDALLHHTRSLTLPTFVGQLYGASGTVVGGGGRSVLSTLKWREELGKVIERLSSSATLDTWKILTATFSVKEEEGDGERKKKRRKLDATPSPTRDQLHLLALFIRSLPAKSITDIPFDEIKERVEKELKAVIKGKNSEGEKWLGVWYEINRRLIGRWELEAKRLEGLRELVREGEGPVVLEAARLLLQSLGPDKDGNASTFTTILGRMKARKSSVAWNQEGDATNLKTEEVQSAMWEMISRRWLVVFELHASEEQLKDLAEGVVASLSDEGEEVFAMASITKRLFRRADFFELKRLQAQFHSSLLSSISLSLPPVLSLLQAPDTKQPKSSHIRRSISLFDKLNRYVPNEYLKKGLKGDSVDIALGVDLVLKDVEWDEAKVTLRKFVLNRGAEGASVELVQVLPTLLKQTSETNAHLRSITLDLFIAFTRICITALEADKATAPLKTLFETFEKPFSTLAKKSKKGHKISLSVEDEALVKLCDVVSNAPAEFTSLPNDLQDVLSKVNKAVSKPFVKIITAQLESDDTAHVASLIAPLQSVWQLRDWMALNGEQHDQVELFSSFAQQALLSVTRSAVSGTGSLRDFSAILSLLRFRLGRLRSLASPEKMSTAPFETWVAVHLAFRGSLLHKGEARAELDTDLKMGTSVATLGEYSAALESLAATLGSTIDADQTLTEAVLEMSLVMLRDGPDGSSRLASSHLTLILRQLSGASSAEKAKSGQELLGYASFLEGVCGDKPMLLSRQNISSVLGVVSEALRPSSTSSTTDARAASSLYTSLATITDHLIRHRKEHVTPLFPQLVGVVISLVNVLRRPGFGSTGSHGDSGESNNVALGRRAERDAQSTFPSWIWSAGSQAIGKNEAKAVGRLLGSLSAKTTTLKRKRGSTEHGSQAISLLAPLSKHAPFILTPYLRACVDSVSPIPSTLRAELQGGMFEIMDSMGKWEREALMKGFLKDDEEAERGVLRGMWRSWEKERYRG